MVDGLIIGIVAALVIIGGLNRIAKANEKIVPFMAVFYIVGGLVIDLSDTFNGLMAIPNLIGVLALSGTVMAITNNYVRRRLKKDKDVSPMLSYFEDIQKEQERGLEP